MNDVVASSTVGKAPSVAPEDPAETMHATHARTITPADVPTLASLDGQNANARSDDAVPGYVRRAMTGDAAAFRWVYAHHRRDVGRLVGRLLGPRPDVEDVVQDVFIQVFRSLPNFRGDSRFSTWLHRVTVNVVLMHLRAAKSRPQYAPEAPAETTASPEGATPIDHVARAERLRALYRILDSVSEKKRAVFILHDIEGVSASDIAALVGAPVLTVRTRLFYARKEVYAAMADDPALGAIARDLSLPGIGGEAR